MLIKNIKGEAWVKKLMKSVMQKTIMAADQIGIYGLFLDADEDAYTFCKKPGFIALQEKVDSEPVPMFLPIDTMRASQT